jgi:ribonuclease P protein component
MIKKKYSLKGKKLFDKAYKFGQRKRGLFLGICKIKNNLEFNRFGIVISHKKIAKATSRNKIKRIIKKYIFNEFENIDSPYDYVITVLKPIDKIEKESIEKETKQLLNI